MTQPARLANPSTAGGSREGKRKHAGHTAPLREQADKSPHREAVNEQKQRTDQARSHADAHWRDWLCPRASVAYSKKEYQASETRNNHERCLQQRCLRQDFQTHLHGGDRKERGGPKCMRRKV